MSINELWYVCSVEYYAVRKKEREAFPGLLWTDLQDILDGGKSKGQSSRHSSHLASERNKRGQNTRTYVCLFSYMCVYFLKVRINQNLFKMVYSLPLKNLQGGRDRQGDQDGSQVSLNVLTLLYSFSCGIT